MPKFEVITTTTAHRTYHIEAETANEARELMFQYLDHRVETMVDLLKIEFVDIDPDLYGEEYVPPVTQLQE